MEIAIYYGDFAILLNYGLIAKLLYDLKIIHIKKENDINKNIFLNRLNR